MIIKLRKTFKSLILNLNKALPKQERAIVVGFPNCESSAIEVANHIYSAHKMPVLYVTTCKVNDDPRSLLLPGIEILQRNGSHLKYVIFYLKSMMSKYVFFTHGRVLNSSPEDQISVNIWHGVLYKNIGLLDGRSGITADVTVGTSELTIDMFAKAFGVPAKTIQVSGYPRNDTMIRAKLNKLHLIKQLNAAWCDFDKIIIWMPTYRKRTFIYDREDGKEAGNPFYIDDFELNKFNEILKAHNTLCIVKPHPMAIKYDTQIQSDNLVFIDDKWVSDQHISLYQLLGCTDMLISDVSSVMIDYLLIDQPILCVSTDFEEYKNSRGFYFKDIENWLPGDVISDQYTFFDKLAEFLITGKDSYEEKRQTLKNAFFKYHDAKSTERLVSHVFNLKK